MAGFGNKVMGMLRLNNGNEDNDMDLLVYLID